MAIFGGQRPVWGKGFSIDRGERDGYIRLAQKGRVAFQLESVIEYGGTTGLEHLGLTDAAWSQLRRLDPSDLDDTDLASIPPPMRWWVNTYGVHTPAALIHDRFIGGTLPGGVTEQHIDRYFRFMLDDAGLPIGKRWIMWSAVALRTRWKSGGAKAWSVVLWLVLALGGFSGMIWAAATGHTWIAAVLVFPVPVLAATLWWKQFGAGVIAAYVVLPFLVVPMLLSVVLLLPFWALEKLASRILEPEVDHEPIWEPLARPPDGPVPGLSEDATAA